MDILSYKMGQNSVEPDKPDQDKTVNPSTQTQVITADTGYELATVTVNPVTSDIDSNIQAENIANGVTILGVTGTLSGGAEPNIFVQTTEPTTKDGIWVNSNLQANNVVVDENIFVNGEWDDIAYQELPANANQIKPFVYNNEFYIWTFAYASDNYKIYKLNQQTHQFDDMNITLNSGESAISSAGTSANNCCGVIGNYLICFIGTTSTTVGCYKIDLVNKIAYNKAINGVFNYAKSCPMITYNNKMYIFGVRLDSTTAGVYNHVITYDLTSDEFTYYNQFPLDSSQDSRGKYQACIYGTKILIINGEKSTKTILDPATSTYSSTGSLPSDMNFYNGSGVKTLVSNNDDVYYGATDGTNTGGAYIKKYDVENNTSSSFVTMYNNIRIYSDGSYLILCNNKMWLTYGSYYPEGETSRVTDKVLKTLSLISKQYTNGDLIIKQNNVNNNAYATQLYDNDFTGKLLTAVTNVYLYQNNQLYANLPTYIGNGTSWEQIK